MTPCGDVLGYQDFGGPCCLQPQVSYHITKRHHKPYDHDINVVKLCKNKLIRCHITDPVDTAFLQKPTLLWKPTEFRRHVERDIFLHVKFLTQEFSNS
jgi:hypothetical protein